MELKNGQECQFCSQSRAQNNSILAMLYLSIQKNTLSTVSQNNEKSLLKFQNFKIQFLDVRSNFHLRQCQNGKVKNKSKKITKFTQSRQR